MNFNFLKLKIIYELGNELLEVKFLVWNINQMKDNY